MPKTKKSSSKLSISPKYNRTFSQALKEQIVSDLDSGLSGVKEICSRYKVSRTSVYKWIYQYSIHHKEGTKQVVEMKSEAAKTEQLRERICELEQVIGQKQLALDYLEKLLGLASEELGYDLKKNIEQKRLRSSGSKKGSTQ